MENTKKKLNSTIAISYEENQRLSAYCKRYKLTKKEFIPLAIRYFDKNGINPEIHSEPKAEIEKINKRINQLFAFIKTQEKEFFRPAIQAIVSTENRLNEDINQISTKEDLNFYFKDVPIDNYIKVIMKILARNEESNIKRYEDLKSEIESSNSKILDELEHIKTKKGFSF